MLCEYAYYENDDTQAKPKCKKSIDDYFDGYCPLIYYCKISGRYENTIDMKDCKYRGDENE